MIATVNSSFLRRSGVRNALEKAESNFFLLREVTAGSGGRNRASVRTTDIPSWERTLTVSNACGQARSPHGQRAGANAIKGMLPERPSGARASTPRTLQLGGGSAGRSDLLLGRLAERVRRDGQRHTAQLARAEHLDRMAP